MQSCILCSVVVLASKASKSAVWRESLLGCNIVYDDLLIIIRGGMKDWWRHRQTMRHKEL